MSLAGGLALMVLTLLPVVPFEVDPAGAHPPPQRWVEVLEWEQTGTRRVWNPPQTHTVPLVPPVPIYETQSVQVSPAYTEVIGSRPIYETQSVQVSPAYTEVIGSRPIYETQSVQVSPAYTEVIGSRPIYESRRRCDLDPITGIEFNCRTVQVQVGTEPITVTHPAVYEDRQVQVGSEPITVTHPAVYEDRQVQVGSEPITVTHPAVYEDRQVLVGHHTTTTQTIPGYYSTEPVYGWVDNGYFENLPHDDSAPEHQNDDQETPDPECTIDPITLLPSCPPETPINDDDEQQNLHELTDDELAELGYRRCEGQTLVTTGETCPSTGTDFDGDEDDCPEGTEWTDDFGGRCVTESVELGKNCDENGENCDDEVEVSTYCPGDSSLESIGTDFQDGNHFTVCYFECDDAGTVPGSTYITEEISNRPDYQCSPSDDDDEEEAEETTCPNGDPMPENGCCPDGTPAPPGGCAGATCPNGDPVPVDGCCPDGTPAPQGGCPQDPTCPDGSEMPAEGCCPGGAPASADGCCLDGTPAPPGGCTTQLTCANGDPMPDEGCCPDGTPAPSTGCGTGLTCPNGDPVPTTGGCCTDGTPAPPGGCGTATCPNGDPVPVGGCCSDGTPAPPGGCGTTTTISPTPIVPTVGGLGACRTGDVVTLSWSATVGSSGFGIERFEVDWTQRNPSAPGGTVNVDSGDRSVDVTAADANDWELSVTPAYIDGGRLRYGSSEDLVVAAGSAPACVPPPACGGITELAGWQGAHNLANPPRDPYAQTGTARPPYDVVAGGLVWVPPRQDAGGIGCELSGRVCFEKGSTPTTCAGKSAVATNTQVPSPATGEPSVQLGWLIEWQWCSDSGGVTLCVGPGDDPSLWHSESGLDVFFDIFSWSNVGRVG